MEGAANCNEYHRKARSNSGFLLLPNHSTTTKACIFDIAFVLIKPPITAQIA
jgi:hypothetical protein